MLHVIDTVKESASLLRANVNSNQRYTKRLATAIYPTPSPTPPPIASTSAVVDNPAPPPFIDVAVFATRLFKKGETIELQGGTAPLSEEQDNLFRKESNKVDFSVIWSARWDSLHSRVVPSNRTDHVRFLLFQAELLRSSVGAGSIRECQFGLSCLMWFVLLTLCRLNSQHDCRSNVEFIHNGKSMSFKVIEGPCIPIPLHYGVNTDDCLCVPDIHPDEQLFTNYGTQCS